MDEHSLTHGVSWLPLEGLVLTGPPNNVRSGRKISSSHYDVLRFESMADGVSPCKQVMKLEARKHVFRYTLQFGQWFEIISKAKRKVDKDGDSGESNEDSATEEGEGKRNGGPEVKCDPLYYTREMGMLMTRLLSCKSHYVNNYHVVVLFWREHSLYGDVLFLVNYGRHGTVPARYPW